MRCYEKAPPVAPRFCGSHSNLGSAHRERGNLDPAVAQPAPCGGGKAGFCRCLCPSGIRIERPGPNHRRHRIVLARAVDLKPDTRWQGVSSCNSRQHACDWTRMSEMAVALPPSAPRRKCAPFHDARDGRQSGAPESALHQLAQAETYRQQPQPLPPAAAERPEKLRVGYFSADFHDQRDLVPDGRLLREHEQDPASRSAPTAMVGHKKGIWRDRMLGQRGSFRAMFMLWTTMTSSGWHAGSTGHCNRSEGIHRRHPQRSLFPRASPRPARLSRLPRHHGARISSTT